MALICSDPDAPGGTFVHWLALGIPPGTRSLPEGASGLRLGTNDFGRQAYNGPCPPAGKPHRYVFEVLALDTRLDLPAGFTREQLEKAASGHVLARGRLTGLYGRK
jgi:Raf kinase inhibitor-like YbhB/YbcL family protein